MKGDADSRPDAPPTAEEIAEAARLREALEGGSGRHEGADFARSIALAHHPRAIEGEAHRAIVEKAIARHAVSARSTPRARLSFAAGALALAAAAALFVHGSSSAPVAAPFEPVAHSRSTQELFRRPFERSGGESARIDRIASARAGDLRDNRFEAWGVR